MAAEELIPVDSDQSRRVELLLHQLEALPTPPAVAITLMESAAAEQASLERILPLAECDPAMTCQLLRLARNGSPREHEITTLRGAAERLGEAAVRGCALSPRVAAAGPGAGDPERAAAFSLDECWQHSLAVAVLCEQLAGAGTVAIDAEQAFVAGLLHDLGMIALHQLLPQRFDRACRFADRSGIALDRACRRIVGLTVHAAGRRLAEHWRLPHMVSDVLWLHGQPSASLPDLPHRPIIELVTLADAIARARYVTPAGHLPRGEDLAELARQLGIGARCVDAAAEGLHEAVTDRAAALAAARPVDPQRLARALELAAGTLGRLYGDAQRSAAGAARQASTLDAITRFHDAAAPGGSFISVFGKVVRSASEVFGGGFFAIVHQGRAGEPWSFLHFAGDGRLLASEVIDPPPGSTAVADLADELQPSMQALAMLPWLIDYAAGARDLRAVRLLPLRCGWGVNAILVHDCAVDGAERRRELEALSRTWAAAIAAAAHHAGAKRLGEQLAETNRALLETRDELTRREKLASLGEIAAGAAHEMNNPLTVISGRAQLLASRLPGGEHREMARQIVDQSHRLSDMISTLRSFAEPVVPVAQPVDLTALLEGLAQEAYREHDGRIAARVTAPPELPPVCIDPSQIARAVRELLRNAAESEGSSDIEVRVQIDPLDDRLQVQIVDDGMGLTRHALAHAFDPFFSAKSAGRQPGLGLAHARRIVEAHGGQLTLENGPARGAVATIRLSGWRGATRLDDERRVA